MIFVLYRDKAGEYRWTLFAANNAIIGASSEGYVNKSDCIANIKMIQNSWNASIDDQTEQR